MSQIPDQTDINDLSGEMNTMTALLAKAESNGYTETFEVSQEGLFSTRDMEKFYTPDQVHIPNFYRFEGASDPADMAILYLIETADGLKGTLDDAYGTYSNPVISNFIKQVEDFHKKVEGNNETSA